MQLSKEITQGYSIYYFLVFTNNNPIVIKKAVPSAYKSEYYTSQHPNLISNQGSIDHLHYNTAACSIKILLQMKPTKITCIHDKL